MLRRSSLVEYVSVLHRTCLQSVKKKLFISICADMFVKIINVYKFHICRQHQGMVPNGDLFLLVLSAEQTLSLFGRFAIGIRRRCHKNIFSYAYSKSSNKSVSKIVMSKIRYFKHKKMSYDDVYVYVGQKPTTRACVVLLFKMPTINKTYLILSC